jgi:hypothetical protein
MTLRDPGRQEGGKKTVWRQRKMTELCTAILLIFGSVYCQISFYEDLKVVKC